MELSGGGFTPFGKVLSAAIALGGIAAQMEPRFRLAAGLIVSKAVYRPWSLLTCAFAADNLLGVRAREEV